MNKSDEIDQLSTALNAVQKVLEGAKASSDNPFFHSKYASLKDVWTACRKPLTDNGLSVTQGGVDDGYYETVLMHQSGQWISFTQRLYIDKVNMQGLGSAITYARRYGLMSVLGLSPLDDDGEASMQRGGGQKQQSQKPLPKGNWLERKKKGEI